MRPIAALAVAASLLAAPASIPVARAQLAKPFGDWLVGCDNLHGCTAIGMTREGGDATAYLIIARSGEPSASPEVTVVIGSDERPGAGRIEVVLDGKALPGLPAPSVDGNNVGSTARLVLRGEPARGLIAALVPARSLSAQLRRAATTEPRVAISLAGSAAALRYMDTEQRRAGTVTALLATGPAPASSIPAPPMMPMLAAQPIRALKPMPQPPGGVARSKDQSCRGDPGMAWQLSATATLWAICDQAGAYNIDYRIWQTGPEKPISPSFDLPWMAPDAERRGTLTNPRLIDDGHILNSFSRGEGPGDCGESADWIWDGSAFRLTGYRAMEVCRGVVPEDWPIRYRTELERR